MGKSEKDFNILAKKEKWKQGKFSLIPLLLFSENTSRAIYFKDVDINTEPTVISDALNEIKIAHSMHAH